MKRIIILLLLTINLFGQDKKISQLTPLPSVSGTELIPLAKSGSNYYMTATQYKNWLAGYFLTDSTKFIPRAGTYTAYPMTGTIEFDNSVSGNPTALWQNINTGGGFYQGTGDNIDLSIANEYAVIGFNSLARSNSVGIEAQSSSPLSSGKNTSFILIEQGSSGSNILCSSSNNLFKGIQYEIGTESYVNSNQDGYSILDRNLNDNRYLFKTGTITINGSTQTFSSNPSFTVSSGTTYTTSTPLTITSSTVIGLNYSSPLTVTSNSLTIPTSNGSTNGYLSSTDWTTFNNKASSSATFTVNGVAMALGTSSTTIAAGTGLTLSTNTLSINTTQNTVTTATALASVGTVTAGTWNSRIQPTYSTVTTSSVVTINTDNYSAYSVTSLSTATTFTIPTGTPTPFQTLIIKVKDSGSSQTLSFSTGANGFRFSQFEPAPTATTSGKWIYIYSIWNAQDGYWDTTWQDGF